MMNEPQETIKIQELDEVQSPVAQEEGDGYEDEYEEKSYYEEIEEPYDK